jgi:Fe-S-cluster containining protein
MNVRHASTPRHTLRCLLKTGSVIRRPLVSGGRKIIRWNTEYTDDTDTIIRENPSDPCHPRSIQTNMPEIITDNRCIKSRDVQENTWNCDISICKSLCCHNCAVLTDDEVSELVSETRKKYNLEFDPKRYFRKVKGEHGTYFAIKMIKGRCIFLNKEERCHIYECRPVLCKLFPVIDVDAIDERCPMANRLSKDEIAILKKRYEDEVDQRIKAEKTFMIV